MSNVLVSGSRSIDNYQLVAGCICSAPFEVNKIIHGGAEGVDTCAEAFAASNVIEQEVFKPDYDKYGKKAPLVRNETMIEKADCLIAVWDGKSSGTKHTISEAKKSGMEKIEEKRMKQKVLCKYFARPSVNTA